MSNIFSFGFIHTVKVGMMDHRVGVVYTWCKLKFIPALTLPSNYSHIYDIEISISAKHFDMKTEIDRLIDGDR